jgi:serine/threonine-protein kinase
MKRMRLPTRYQPTEKYSSGGFGDVLICKDTHLDRLVAIKFIKDLEEMPRMQDEINALMTLRSKHVVQLFDIIEKDGQLAIVEEYIPGPDLVTYTDSIENVLDFIKVVWQISAGIAEIHAHEIVHRDIKPNNIKLDGEGIVKIYDFGLSRSNDNAKTVGFKGTLIFAAPELFKGRGAVSFTSAVDTFAFGVTALCLAKIPPPQALNTATKILTENPFLASPFKIPRSIQNILFKCLSVEPDLRPEMSSVSLLLQRQLLKNSHRALLIHKNSQHILDKDNKGVTLRRVGVGSVSVSYNGFEFFIQELDGEVTVNNRTPRVDDILPESCVIIIGKISRPSRERSAITFDISHPEVVL